MSFRGKWSSQVARLPLLCQWLNSGLPGSQHGLQQPEVGGYAPANLSDQPGPG